MIDEYLNPDKSLEERLNIIDSLIDETKKDLKRYPECAFPKEHELYKQRLHSYELTKSHLKDVLFEEIIKRWLKLTTLKISDLFSDCPLILEDDGKYYELRMSGVAVSGFDDTPIQIYLRKGDRIYKKDLKDIKWLLKSTKSMISRYTVLNVK